MRAFILEENMENEKIIEKEIKGEEATKVLSKIEPLDINNYLKNRDYVDAVACPPMENTIIKIGGPATVLIIRY